MAPRAADKAAVYHNLATLLGSGVPIRRSLETVSQGAGGQLRQGLEHVHEHVGQGHSLAEAMAQIPQAFPPLDRRLVTVAEESGRLSDVFEELSQWYQFRKQLRQELLGGLAMPVLVLHAAAVLIPLPGAFLGRLTVTQFVFRVVQLLMYFYVPLAMILAVGRFASPSGPFRRTLDAAAVRLPLVGPGLRDLALARFFRAFHVLYSAGTDICRAMETAIDVGGNRAVMRQFAGGLESARRGHLISTELSLSLPAEIRQAWATGEASGNLDVVTERLAVDYSQRARNRMTTIAVWLPRVLYLLLMVRMAIAVVHNATQVLSAVGL